MRNVTIGVLFILLMAGCGGGENAPAGGTTAAPSAKADSAKADSAKAEKPEADEADDPPEPPPDTRPLAAIVAAVEACPKDGDCPDRTALYERARKATKDELLAALRSAKDPISQAPLVEGLGRSMDDSLIPVIEPFITSRDFGLKRAAHQALAAKGSEAALAKLAELLDNHDQTDTVHGDVPELLAKYPQSAASKAAVPRLKKMAAEDAQGVGRGRACTAVAAIEGEAAIPFLAERAEKEQWEGARLDVAKALAGFAKDPKAQAALKKLAADKDSSVQKAAKKALGE